MRGMGSGRSGFKEREYERQDRTGKTTTRRPNVRRGASRPAALEVVQGTEKGALFVLKPGTWTLGRSNQASFKVLATGVSRLHGRLVMLGDERIILHDLGSTNGTRVNGKRIRAPLRLEEGDRIELGGATLLLRLLGPDELFSVSRVQERVQEQPELPLSERELQVTRLVARGLTNAEIGASLEISGKTVGRHLENIFRKLRIRTRAQLAVWVTQRGKPQ